MCKIDIPEIDLKTQKSLLEKFENVNSSLSLFRAEASCQQNYFKKLRQQILQEAIEGKLTAEWRKNNPELISGDNHALKLLERVKLEREQLVKEKKTKKQKPLAPINDGEKLFDLPEGWVWCRLGEICDFIYGNSLTKSQCKEDGKYPVYGSNGVVGHYDYFLTKKRAIIIGRKGSAGALNVSQEPSWTIDVAYYVEESKNINFEYLFYLLKSQQLEKLGKGIKPGVNRTEAYNLPIVCSPAAEQNKIVERVEKLMSMVDELEKQVIERKEQSELLMHSVLQEAFEVAV